MNLLTSPYAFLVLAMLGWSGNVLLGRAMHETFTPTSLSFWRWSLALALALAWLARPLWRKRAVLLREWKVLGGLGLMGVSAFNWLLYQAVETTTATNTALIYANTPIFVVAASRIFLGERITWGQGAGIAVSTLGVTLVVTRGDPALLLSMGFTVGDLWALATVPVWGVYMMLLKHRPPELTPVELQGALMIVGWLGIVPLYLLERAEILAVPFSIETAMAVLYLAAVASILCFVLWNCGVEAVGAGRAALFAHLYPLFATVLAMVFLGEALRPFHLLGGAMIFLGLALTTLRAGRPVPSTEEGEHPPG